MTRIEKFALCKAMFDSAPPEGSPLRAHQWTLTLNAVANATCPGYDEGVTFRDLANRDNWGHDNPFRDD